MKVIFLDIDGVLNTPRSACTYAMERRCIDALSDIISETGAALVISSSWRYFIHNGYMTERGFEVLLRSHGLTGCVKVIGATRPDEGDELRGVQIASWLASNSVESFVILDDDYVTGFDGRLVQTDSARGLTPENASEAIRILTPERAARCGWRGKEFPSR